MTPEQLQMLVREQEPYIFNRMFRAVEQVPARLERACRALNKAGIPYAIIGGNTVAAWVATKDDGAVRNTRDVDLLLREVGLIDASWPDRMPPSLGARLQRLLDDPDG